MIGLGTGVTAGELGALDEVESVTVAEISQGVIDAAPFFDFANLELTSNPKIEILRSDAYRALLKGRQSYDVIVSEPSNPWVTGVEMLFSREFLEEARDRLSERGVYCQWFHLYETSNETVDLVLSTYAQVFDHVAIWSVNSADLLLLGFKDPRLALDLAHLEKRMGQTDLQAGLSRSGLRGPAALLAHEMVPLGVIAAADLADEVHSLYRPTLSFRAGRAFFAAPDTTLPFTGYGEPARVGHGRSLLRRRLQRFAGQGIPEPVWQRILTRACRMQLPTCETWLAAWKRQSGSSQPPEWLSRFQRIDERWATAAQLETYFGGPGETSRLSPIDAVFATTFVHAQLRTRRALRPVGARGSLAALRALARGAERHALRARARARARARRGPRAAAHRAVVGRVRRGHGGVRAAARRGGRRRGAAERGRSGLSRDGLSASGARR